VRVPVEVLGSQLHETEQLLDACANLGRTLAVHLERLGQQAPHGEPRME
jgi:hypothetical protein